jgi:hypothetical protein
MAASPKSGRYCAVKIGTYTVLGQGQWSLSGVTADQLDASEFGLEWKQFEFGMLDGGQISFSGLFDPADSTGQEALREANIENTDMTTLRLYVDNTSYYEPCQTSGYLSPSTTSGASTEVSHVNIISFDISADKSGLMQTSFTAKVSGAMVLV